MSKLKNERLHGLDHLRALAIMLVLIFHYEAYYGIPASLAPTGLVALSGFGWTGVDLFFVLSGYLIGDKLLGDIDHFGRIRFSAFYLNRAFRIFPAYLVAVTIYFSFTQVQEGRALQPLWRFLTFTQNLPIDLFANTFSHAWSLCVEEHFYLLLPAILYLLFARRLHGRGLYIILGLLALGLMIRWFNWSAFVDPSAGRQRTMAALKYIYYPTYARLDGLVVGVAIAVLFRYLTEFRDRITRHGDLMLVAGLIALLACYELFGGARVSVTFTTLPTTLVGFPLLSIGYGLLVVAALSPTCFLFRLRFRPTAALATYAYAIYLVHKMTNHWINENLQVQYALSDTETFAICLVAAVAGGAALHYSIEKPFLTLRDHLLSGKSRGGRPG